LGFRVLGLGFQTLNFGLSTACTCACVRALGGFDAWESELELLRCKLAFDASSSSLYHQSLRCSEGKMRSGLAMCGLF
jgi:hypothetical protein